MGEKDWDDPWYQFEVKYCWGPLEIEVKGGLTFDGIGVSLTVERTPFYYGLFAFRILVSPVFFDVLLFWREPEKLGELE